MQEVGGVDAYANAISDVYQDNFKEGIFTGKGIYDLETFSEVLCEEIPENTVLSHDLLEGSYLRCALVSDIMLMDGYPASYNSFKARLHRWIRGDYQIIGWVGKEIIDKKERSKRNPLNRLSKYKIVDNLIRAITPIATIVSIILFCLLIIFKNVSITGFLLLLILSMIAPTVIDLVNKILYKKEGETYQKTFTPRISSIAASSIRGILEIMALPDKAYYSANAIVKTIYRLKVSKKHLLEWTTSEDAEKTAKTDILSYYKNMYFNLIMGVIGLLYGIVMINHSFISIYMLVLSILWLIAPSVFWYISKIPKQEKVIEEISKQDKEYLLEIGKRTWQFFKDSLTEENHYLPPDNYQEERKVEFVDRTSSTNIGLGLLSVISSYDLGYENLEDTLKLLNKMLISIETLQKWNGHLYNWYNIRTLEPLIPRYISTVDSGNFIGYIYVLKEFYKNIKEKLQKGELEENQNVRQELLLLIPDWVDKPNSEIPIANADFKKLYDEEKQLFSIGFNIEENKLTDSYYDLLASEARQASLIAISKKDIPSKHWYKLSRTLTTMDGYNGLVSWSGTAFEYLMPNIIIKQETGSLIDESCKFMLMSQKKYAKKLDIPWGFSETAFYLKDLNQNYQYKAIGIPWLGLKRGLEEDMVVATYASIMALLQEPQNVINNIKVLEKQGMYDKYGFYESIDYTPIRMPKDKKQAIVKTYMAHHQALILLSINNLFHDKVLQKRFSSNPEINAVEILLQEKMPENRIITKEEKIKPTKITYINYKNYAQRIYTKTQQKLPAYNVIANENYSVVMDVKGRGYSKYKNYFINRFYKASDETQGIFFYLKNIKNKRIWTSNDMNYLSKADKYEMVFSEDSDKIKRIDGSIESVCKVTVSSEKPVEIRRLELTNNGIEEETIEVTTAIEPCLTTLQQQHSHPAFQNLFLTYEYLEDENIFIIKRKDRENTAKGLFLAVSFFAEDSGIGDLEYEIDKEKFQGRGNLALPIMVENSKPFSKKIQFVVDPILALRRTIALKPEQTLSLNLVMSVAEEKEIAIQNIKEYQSEEKIRKAFELSVARADTEARYLGLRGNQIETYQKMLGYLLFSNPLQSKEKFKAEYYPKEELWQYGISGDLPILLVKIRDSNDMEILEEVLKAYEFFRLKNIELDLVILNEESNSYEKYTKETIQNAILNINLGYLQNRKGGIFIIENENAEIVEFHAKLTIDTRKGPIERQLQDLEEEYLENVKEVGAKVENMTPIYEEEKSTKNKEQELLYENEYGGFSQDGKEYHISIYKEDRLPTVWSHMMANSNFGTLITDSMGGYSWSQNSALNKITNWSNNQVVDNPSEVIYLQEQETLKTWSLGLNPMPDKQEYHVVYGFGYAKYEHISAQIEQNLTVFVPREDSVKISMLELRNLEPKKKKLNLIYYIKPVLGENEINTNGYIDMKLKDNMLLLQNKTNTDFKKIIYITSSEKIKSYTGSRKFFFGEGNLSDPDGLKKLVLNNENSLGKDAIAAIQIEIELEAFERKQISLLLGSENTVLDCQDKVYQYTKISNIQEELEGVKKEWSNILEKVQVNTPLTSFNILMNGWLTYQTITSRLRARSAFYQAGGAFGFRDQLQDTIGLKYFSPNIMKEQIIKHSKHQFIEGDVEHWWHDETKKGIRTLFSDDLLWLVYVVEQYIEFTGDFSILEIETPYVEGEKLENGIEEKYDEHLESKIRESIFMHCERALQKSLQFGENGLPKIGSGDWNDGFSKVGNKGKGESVWLGFFLYDILTKWIKVLEERGHKLELEEQKEYEGTRMACPFEAQKKIEEYKQILEKLKKALNTVGWDGRWYKRAFMDDGSILGTLQNEECRIDGISQSWSVISNAGDNDKKYISMESLENHLVDRESGIIKLLDPPFEKSKLEPGYIKAYLPGTRENGGQYTHGAIWAIIAEAMLGFGDKALELFRMINPIEHARTKEAALKYKVEPYVIAADIYGQGNLAGRGGWTWYTGSSSWMYEAGLKYILGINIQKGYLSINPAIPSNWKEYSIRYKNGNSIYNIQVKNPNGKNTGVETMILNGQIVEEKKIYLQDDGKVHYLEVIM